MQMGLRWKSIHEHVVINLASQSDTDTVFDLRAYDIFNVLNFNRLKKKKNRRKIKKKEKKTLHEKNNNNKKKHI